MKISPETRRRMLRLVPSTTDQLTAGDVASILEIPRRKVQLYVEDEIVEPLNCSPGTGNKREYGLRELAQFKVAAELQQLGIKPSVLKPVMRVIRSILRSEPYDNVEHEGPLLFAVYRGRADAYDRKEPMVVKALDEFESLKKIRSPGLLLIDYADIESVLMVSFLAAVETGNMTLEQIWAEKGD